MTPLEFQDKKQTKKKSALTYSSNFNPGIQTFSVNFILIICTLFSILTFYNSKSDIYEKKVTIMPLFLWILKN